MYVGSYLKKQKKYFLLRKETRKRRYRALDIQL